MPVEAQLTAHVAHRGTPAACSNVHGKPLRIAWIVGQKVQTLQLHPAASTAVHTARLQLQDNPVSAATQVADLPLPAVVPALAPLAAAPTWRFFERRSRLTINVPASPSASRISARGRNSPCLYTSNKRRFGFARILMPK